MEQNDQQEGSILSGGHTSSYGSPELGVRPFSCDCVTLYSALYEDINEDIKTISEIYTNNGLYSLGENNEIQEEE